MNTGFWKDKYPMGTSVDIDTGACQSIIEVLADSVAKYAHRPAFSNLGKTLSYAQLYELSGRFCSYLQQHTDLQPGDRIAIMLPNLLQYPVAVFGALRAGLIVVNTNPLYTPREMTHQFVDSGARGVVILANMAHKAQQVLPETAIDHVIVTELGDLLSPLKRWLVNATVRHIKKMVPDWSIPGAQRFNRVLALGGQQPPKNSDRGQEDVAVLQYTGGTTGVAKGAMLTHRNIISNMLQTQAMVATNLKEGHEKMVAPLPLYHIFAFTVHCMLGTLLGAHNLLITNPKDLDGFVKTLKNQPFSMFVGLNTLFVSLMNHPGFRQLDFTRLKYTVSGGMALQMDTARRWEQLTDCRICEGYGMTETSPVVTVNPMDAIRLGTIGLPVPSCDVQVIDDQGQVLAVGEVGELCIRGPQVMKGYWNNAAATAASLSGDGWLKTGDMARIDAEGYVTIVDRKKDMVCVSGFNVYPNELEDVLAQHPAIRQCAVIGVPCEKTGEAIKAFIVASSPDLSRENVLKHCRQYLTGYKVPRLIEFRSELPLSNVGKVLRQALREEAQAAAKP